jgi:hypothetical protein
MGGGIVANTARIVSMEKAHSHGKMAVDIRASGLLERDMALVSTRTLKDLHALGCGRWTGLFTGMLLRHHEVKMGMTLRPSWIRDLHVDLKMQRSKVV